MTPPDDHSSGNIPEEGPGSRRHIPLDGAFNARDLGGYETADGRTTNWGKYVRCDTLANLTTASRDALIDYGVRNVIDLRRSSDLQHKPSAFIGCDAVTYYHQNMAGDMVLDGEEKREEIDDHAQRRGFTYCLILEQHKYVLRQIFSILARGDSLPAIVHCNAGKDRAGICAAFVLDICGVPRETIVADYALTARFNIVRYFLQHPEVSPDDYSWQEHQAASCNPATMGYTLDFLDERYGGIQGYLRDTGITDTQLDAIRTAMTT